MSQVQEFVAKLPDPVQTLPVTAEVRTGHGDETVTFNGEFDFVRVPSIDIDDINASMLKVSPNGQADPKGLRGHRHRVIAHTVRENGRPLQLAEVEQWPHAIVLAVFEIAARVNGLNRAQAASAAEKKSDATGASGG